MDDSAAKVGADALAELERLEEANFQLQALSSYQDQFLSAISHDLQTPPVVIQGIAELLIRGHYGPLTVEQEKAVKIVHRNIFALSQMLQQLLEFSRLLRDRPKPTGKPISMQLCLKDVIASSSRALEVAQVHIAPLDLPEAAIDVRIDSRSMELMLSNILANTARAISPCHAISITLRREGQKAKLAMKAEPIRPELPIAERLAQKFFVPLAKGEDETGAIHPLGPAAGDYLSRLLGGELEVTQPGGTALVFTLTLPIAQGNL